MFDYVSQWDDTGLSYDDLPEVPHTTYKQYEEIYGLPFGDDRGHQEIEADCGDDLVVVSNSVLYLYTRLEALKLLDMKISVLDTSINRGSANYTESLIIVPRTYHDTWHSFRKLRDRSTFAYIDIPKLRYCLPGCSTRMKFSDTVQGKMDGLGSSVKFVENGSPTYAIMFIASLYQDIFLGATSATKSPYLPKTFSGYGKPIPTDSPSNFVRFHDTFKNGQYKQVVSTLVSEVIQYMDACSDFESGKTKLPPEPGELMLYASTDDPVFTDWVKGSDKFTKCIGIPIPEYLAEYKVCDMQVQDSYKPAYDKLLHEGLLVSETKLKIALDHNLRTEFLLGACTYNEFLLKLEESKESWKSFNLFSQEGLGLPTVLQPTSTTVLSARRFLSIMDTYRNIRKMIRSESLYSPDALRSVYIHGPMMAAHDMLIRQNNDGEYSLSRANIDNVHGHDAADDGHLKELVEWANGPRGVPPPTILIDDDKVLMSSIKENSVLITDDIRLCRSLNETKGIQIFRIPVEFYYRKTYFSDGEFPLPERVSSWPIVMDQGSIDSGEEKYFFNGMFYPEGVNLREASLLRERGVPWNFSMGKELDFSEVETVPTGWPHYYLFNRTHHAYGRKKKPNRGKVRKG